MSIKARAGEEEEGIWKHNQDCSFSRRRRDMPPPFRANRDNSRFSSDVHFNLSASYLKRADQSVSGQFHQHLNTTPPPSLLRLLSSLAPTPRFLPLSLLLLSANETTPQPFGSLCTPGCEKRGATRRKRVETGPTDEGTGRKRERERKEGDGQVLKSVG